MLWGMKEGTGEMRYWCPEHFQIDRKVQNCFTVAYLYTWETKQKKKDILNRRQNILEGITRPLRQQRISKKSKKSRRWVTFLPLSSFHNLISRFWNMNPCSIKILKIKGWMTGAKKSRRNKTKIGKVCREEQNVK